MIDPKNATVCRAFFQGFNTSGGALFSIDGGLECIGADQWETPLVDYVRTAWKRYGPERLFYDPADPTSQAAGDFGIDDAIAGRPFFPRASNIVGGLLLTAEGLNAYFCGYARALAVIDLKRSAKKPDAIAAAGQNEDGSKTSEPETTKP